MTDALKQAAQRLLAAAKFIRFDSLNVSMRDFAEVCDSIEALRAASMLRTQHAELTALRARAEAAEAKVAIPDGMVLVPIEPPVHAVARMPGLDDDDSRRNYRRVIAAASGGLLAFSCRDECEVGKHVACGDWCGDTKACLAVFKAVVPDAEAKVTAPESCEKCYQDGFLDGQQYGRGEAPVAVQAVPLEDISRVLADAMNGAAENGANSVSMPDYMVRLAFWLDGIKQPGSETT